SPGACGARCRWGAADGDVASHTVELSRSGGDGSGGGCADRAGVAAVVAVHERRPSSLRDVVGRLRRVGPDCGPRLWSDRRLVAVDGPWFRRCARLRGRIDAAAAARAVVGVCGAAGRVEVATE